MQIKLDILVLFDKKAIFSPPLFEVDVMIRYHFAL